MRWRLGRSRTEQKKCMDLFWKIAHERLNPTGVPIRVGDFGTVDSETGEFLQEGNVFEHPASKEIMAELDPVRNASTVRHTHIFKHTKNVSRVDVPLGGGIGLTGIAEGNVTVQFQFESERGVLLFMHDVTFTTLHIGKPWAERLERHTSEFRDKAIVTETYSCRHYDLRMGRAGEHSVEITGTAEIPIPAAPALSASANVGFKTARKAGFGSAWHGTKNTETESDDFVPLYRLKAFNPFRDLSDEQPDEWVLCDVDPPGYKPPLLVWPRPLRQVSSDEEEDSEEEEEEEEASEEEVIRTLRYMPALQPDNGVVYNIPAPDFGMPGPAGELDSDKNGKDIISSDKKVVSRDGSEVLRFDGVVSLWTDGKP
ncbi:hypothetical protein ARMGADRAFT_1019411 [Armillaria gallica]|uniref:Uncharacterized protein n=1 Tax=Armillaria gallica TaxID=47427 RepID=A0A2H3CWG5_ARMGA|nr:hypothetical protein ARMGADRAFT_1019411 [Armillaria gallica]